jgi:predicted metal-dependent peptidase
MGADVSKEIDRVSYELLLREPYFGHFFVGLIRQVIGGSGALGIARHGNFLQLVVSRDYWENVLVGPELRQGAIKHELLHLTFKHPLRCHAYAHRELFSLAADLVVNQHLRQVELPPNAGTLDLFPELELERDQTADYYYHALMPLFRVCRGGGDGAESPKGLQAMQDYLSGENAERERHQQWPGFSDASSAERTLIETSLDTLIYHTVKRLQGRSVTWGSVGGSLKEYLESLELFAPPSVDWRRVLRLFATSAERTYVKSTISRPSRRYGTVPGVKIKRRTKILVAMDTSGSVSAEDLIIFFRELHHLWRQGAQVQVVECDTNIARSYPYRGTTPTFVQGRGGTAFDGPITFANTTFHPDAIVYFTDGFAPAPKVASRCPILWLVSSSGADLKDLNDFPGRRIKMRQN